VAALLTTGRPQARSKINWQTEDKVEQELAIDLAAEPAPEIGPVLAELELVQVAAEREPVLVVVELELAQVTAVPERDLVAAEPERDLVVAVPELAQEVVVPARGPPRAQLAVALKTKSVITARRHDLVLRLAAGDLAAAAVTTREPAATEGVIAWEAADTVAVEAAVVVVVVVDVAVAEDGDNIR
jgi:hypothetical protein